jgi:hypothetical protein
MSVQASQDNNSVPFIRFANPAVIDEEAVLSQDAGRSAVLASKTLMAKIAATQKWEPFTDETATDGTALPQGIYVGPDIAAADLVAGDVVDNQILVGAALIDANQLVIENSKTLDTVINATGGADNINIKTVRDYLADKGLFVEDTTDISGFQA